MRFKTLVVALGGMALLPAACGGTADPDVGGDDVTAEFPERPVDPVRTERVSLSWVAPDGDSWPLDVVAPVDDIEGGWPVLVTFHGAEALGTSASNMSAVAASGTVVVGPRWVIPEWSISNLDALDADDYVDGALFDIAKCALGAAQEAAADHGGNPDWTTVEGFSAGVHPAAWVGLGVVRDDPCPDTDIVAPAAMVVGDSQWLFEGFGGEWDATFLDETSRATDTVDRFLNPERWNVPDGFVAYLWSSESTDVDRAVENPPAADSWVRSRGGDDIVADLDSVGAFDDESIGFLDNGLLQQLRMKEAGLPVLHEQLPGGHSRKSEMIDRTIELVWREPVVDN
jgi:hypothetical protein